MKLSIVTVHLNNLQGLAATLKSMARMLGQQEVQWLVIDGGTKAEDIAGRAVWEHVRCTASRFVSEPDGGIYAAMNKGTAQATGEYVLYLNAGDEMHPDFSLKGLAAELQADRPAMIWGTSHERYANGALVRVKNRSPALAWYGMPVNHQNVLFRRDVLGNSPYDTRYQICADYDLVSRILLGGGQAHRTRMPIAIFQRGGTNYQNLVCTLEEESLLRCLHHGVPKSLSKGIKRLKMVNAKISRVPTLRRWLRKWV